MSCNNSHEFLNGHIRTLEGNLAYVKGACLNEQFHTEEVTTDDAATLSWVGTAARKSSGLSPSSPCRLLCS